MDNRPIGVFDSGLGGLTAMKELRRVLPHEDIIYFGDTGRVPYGGRSEATLIKYARQDIHFLQSFDIKAILIACGTVSTILPKISEEMDIPVIGVVEPSAKRAASLSENKKIGIIGTNATISSGAYEKALRVISADIVTESRSCPLFVPLVENGRFLPGDIVIETIAEEYLEQFLQFGCDTLIMGCTHYPLLREIIEHILPGVSLVDSGAEASDAICRLLKDLDMLNGSSALGSTSYNVSDDPLSFARNGGIFMGSPLGPEVNKVDIDNF